MSHETTEAGVAQQAPAALPVLPVRQLTGIIGALALAAFLMILNETVLTVALPSVMADMGVSETSGQWLTTGFLLTMSVVIPTTGFLLQRFTTRSLFIFALGSFLAGTLLAVFAPSFAVLLIARIVQAVGTAIVLPLLMTTTLTHVPRHKRGAVMGLNSIVISVGPAIGPTVSGAIVNAFSWRYIFALMLPLALIILVLGIIFIKIPSTTRKLPVDVFSVLLSAVAFGFLVYAISSVEHAADNLLLTAGSLVVGTAGLVLFVTRQVRLARTGRELLNLSPFRNRNFSISISMIMIAMGTLLGTVMIVPIILQTGNGVSTLAIGLMLLPGGLVQAIAAPIAGRVFDRFGPRPVLVPGAALLALGQWLYVTVTPDTELWVFMVNHIVFSIGLAMLMTGLLSSALATVDPRLYGHGSAIFNTGQQLGGAIGTTIFVTALSMLSAGRLEAGSDIAGSLFAGAHTAFLIGAIVASIGVVLAPFVRIPRRS
ncbi:MDR family MFS transporter [Arthrobacter sp. 7Tela_A1]|uniref:MDR family MFS transporter n=1 Tax=Arthrobacter sp. 7Tela_A1 TaxID=3093745 RepID=UPI003BB81472